MTYLLRISVMFVLALQVLVPEPRAAAMGNGIERFAHSGDGALNLVSKKNGSSFKGAYRKGNGSYDPNALETIHAVWGASYGKPVTSLSLRLIEFIDFLQDKFDAKARIYITSGFRSPTYNKTLRDKGRLAAKASLHQYGMAADLKIEGVSSKRVWHFVRKLNFGGTGYYQGENVHVDVGPARWWDGKTSGVGTGLANTNKLIGLVTDFDRYLPDEIVTLRFIRMTAFPIGVTPEFVLQRENGKEPFRSIVVFKPSASRPLRGQCPQFKDIAQMANLSWHLPPALPPGRYVIQARFCEPSWEEMPAKVVTPVFEVIAP